MFKLGTRLKSPPAHTTPKGGSMYDFIINWKPTRITAKSDDEAYEKATDLVGDEVEISDIECTGLNESYVVRFEER